MTEEIEFCPGQVFCNRCGHKEQPVCPGGRPVHDPEDQDAETARINEATNNVTVLTFLAARQKISRGNYLDRNGD